jgi:competence protein ComEC
LCGCQYALSPVSGELTVYFLNVGQGDSEIVTLDGHAMLIDAGTNASTTTLISDIKSIGITKFDMVIGTIYAQGLDNN